MQAFINTQWNALFLEPADAPNITCPPQIGQANHGAEPHATQVPGADQPESNQHCETDCQTRVTTGSSKVPQLKLLFPFLARLDIFPERNFENPSTGCAHGRHNSMSPGRYFAGAQLISRHVLGDCLNHSTDFNFTTVIYVRPADHGSVGGRFLATSRSNRNQTQPYQWHVSILMPLQLETRSPRYILEPLFIPPVCHKKQDF